MRLLTDAKLQASAVRNTKSSVFTADQDVFFQKMDQGACVIEVLFDNSRAIDYRFIAINKSFISQTGLEDACGRTMRSLRPDHEDHWFQIYGDVARTGEAIRFENPAAALGRWYDVYAFRVDEQEQDQNQVGIIFHDITERKQIEQRAGLLAAEMGHRNKNTWALISSMVRLTKGATIAEYQARLMGRINALAHSQTAILENDTGLADLGRLVQTELAMYRESGEERIICRGPTVTLIPSQTQSILLAIHELGVNAFKYGALSSPTGQVTVDWSWRENGQLELRWTERGGPTVVRPRRHGLGTGVIKGSVQGPFGTGDVIFDWQPEGLVCTLVLSTGL